MDVVHPVALSSCPESPPVVPGSGVGTVNSDTLTPVGGVKNPESKG